MFSILGGVASGLASAGIQQMFTDYNREQDFGNYQKAQEQNFINAQDSQRNAPILTKLGMEAAGLNPAGMSNPTPVSTPSAPLGSHNSPSVNLAQDNNLMADARLKNAEAEKTELENDQIQGENEASFANYKSKLRVLKVPIVSVDGHKWRILWLKSSAHSKSFRKMVISSLTQVICAVLLIRLQLFKLCRIE